MKAVSQKKVLGQGMTEYIIIVALIAVSAIGVYKFFGQTVRAQMAGISRELAGESETKAREIARDASADAVSQTKEKNLKNYAGDN
jgi:type IV pilus assembly protein PilA